MSGPVEIFVDESRRRDYLLCGVEVAARDIARARRAMRSLKPNNRDRLHMHAESRNREALVREFVRLAPIAGAHVFIASGHVAGRSERRTRDLCLRDLALHAVDVGASRILVESCDQDRRDRAALIEPLVTAGALDRVLVEVDVPTSHELLWAADLVAWAYGAGGTARRLIEPLVVAHAVR